MPEMVFPAAPIPQGSSPLSAPSYWSLQQDDLLEVTSLSPIGVFGLQLTVRMLQADGSIKLMFFTLQTGQNVWQTQQFNPGPGVLLNATIGAVHLSGGFNDPKWGQCFVKVGLAHGAGVARLFMGTILQGYVTIRQDLAWPGSPIQGSQQGAGAVGVHSGNVNVPGQELTLVVPINTRWRLMALKVFLTTDATAGTRLPGLLFQDPTGVEFFRSGSPGSAGPSGGATFNWAQGMPLGNIPSPVCFLAGLAEGVLLAPGSKIRTITAALSAGDIWGQPTVVVEEWVDGD